MHNMNRYIVSYISLILFLSVFSASAQDFADRPDLKEIKGKKLLEKLEPKQHEKSGKWGYANEEGKFVIKPEFDAALPYEGKLARVSWGGKWGAINDKGLYQIHLFYDAIEAFSSDSLAICSRFNNYTLLNAYGRHVGGFWKSIDYADYGYVVSNGEGLLGTLSHQGDTLLSPQFEHIEVLDRSKGISHIKKDGKWGLLKGGDEILAIKWDKPLDFLQSGIADHPDLYMVLQNGKIGVVSLYGDYVVPPIYDSFEMHSSGNYYVTTRNGKYGAISLKMEEIIPAVRDTKPHLGEHIMEVYDDGKFYCANYKGKQEFGLCADIYYMLKPDEYVTTKYFPTWAKTHLIEENNLAREELVYKASALCSKMEEYGYNPSFASGDGNLPTEFALSIPQDQQERYGILKRAVFQKTSANGALYKAAEDDVNNMVLEYSHADGAYVLRMDDLVFSVDESVRALNIREFEGFYPKEYAKLNEDLIMVSIAFVRSAEEASTELVEKSEYMLPLPSFPIKVFTGKADPSRESLAVITFSLDSLKAVSCVEVPQSGSGLIFSSFGGFYSYSGGSVVAETSAPLRRFDRYGRLDWEYVPMYGEVYYDIEETENYIYICGSAKQGNVETPIVRQLSKRGKSMTAKYGKASNARYSGAICRDHILYLKTSFLKGSPAYGKDYYPTFCLEDMNDNFGVWCKCVWEDWGGEALGGMGLTGTDGKWLCTPNISEDMSVAYDWEIGRYGDCGHVVVRHHRNYGLAGKHGQILIEPKYESLKQLSNPAYFCAMSGGRFGVVDTCDRVIVPFEYSYVGDMSEDMIIVSKDRMYGCYNKEGQIVIPLEYEDLREFVGGMARIRFKKRFGFIDKSGEMVVAPFSDEVENFSEGFTLVTIKDKVGFVSLDGDWIAPPMYEAGHDFSGGLAPLSMNGKFGYIDNTGNFVIPMQFSDVQKFNASCGLACVASEGRWGVINASGRVIIPLEFEKVQICSDGYVLVKKDGKFGIYTYGGKLIFEPECDTIEVRSGERLFAHGVASARLDGNLVGIDAYGNVIHKYTMLTK